MSAQFSDDDIGKSVVNANGDEVGIVASVEHGTAHVEPDPGITDTIKAKLGWEGTGEEAYPLQEQAVARVTDDEIRLESDLSGAGSSHTDTSRSTGTATGGTTGDRDTGMRDDDDDLIGDDDDSLIGDDDHQSRRDRDDDSLIGDDDDDLIGDDDDSLIGDDDDDLIGDDDDHRSRRDRDDDDDDIL